MIKTIGKVRNSRISEMITDQKDQIINIQQGKKGSKDQKYCRIEMIEIKRKMNR